MEQPLPKDYDLQWHHKWWRKFRVIDSETLINKLNLNIPFRDYTAICMVLFERNPNWSSDISADELMSEVLFNRFQEKILKHYLGHIPYTPKGDIDYQHTSELQLNFAKYSPTMFGMFGLANNPFGNNRNSFHEYLSMYITQMFKNNYMLNLTRATTQDLLNGKLLYKRITDWIDQYGHKKTLWHVKWLTPCIPAIKETFEFTYSHRKDNYEKVKNGRPYKLYQFTVLMTNLDKPQEQRNSTLSQGKVMVDKNNNKIETSWEIHTFNHKYESSIHDKIVADGKNPELYHSMTTGAQTNPPKIYFIPDVLIGRVHRDKTRDLLTTFIRDIKTNEIQHLDLLKNNLRLEYLTTKYKLDYFGDVDLEIAYLDSFDIEGYVVKSKPIHILNWLLANNPLGGGDK